MSETEPGATEYADVTVPDGQKLLREVMPDGRAVDCIVEGDISAEEEASVRSAMRETYRKLIGDGNR